MAAKKKPPRFITLGWQVIDWIETYLVHGPGDVEGDPIEIDDEFIEFILRCYELGRNGRRKIRRAFLSRPKGRAKSELAGMLACVEALGPVRFDGWDANKEPVGRPVRSPEILCMATEEDQAGNTYDNIHVMLSHVRDTFRREFPHVDPGLTRTFAAAEGRGEIIPITARARSKDGGKSTFVVFDETHLYDLHELRKAHATILRNLGKRKLAEPWSLETSTMYEPGAGSVAEATHEYARSVEEGRIKDNSLLFDHREIAGDVDWDDDKALKAALAELYGPAAEWVDLDRILQEIRDPTADFADSQRYWGNVAVASSDAWLATSAWDAVYDKDRIVADDELITLGFDGSRFDDSTALIGCCISDGHLFTIGVWEKPEGTKGIGWEVPRGEVDAKVHWAMETYTVARMNADPPYWQDEVDDWFDEWSETVFPWWTNRRKDMALALERLHTAVLTEGEVSHDGDSRLRRHMGNARKHETAQGTLIRKPKKNSPKKIDAAMAATLAYEARAEAIADGILKKRRRKRGASFNY